MSKKKQSEEKVNAYWQERIKAEMAYKQEQDASIGDEMKRLHEYHMKQIEKEIDAFYQKYANDNKISLKEARKRASQMDVVAFQDKARRYVEEKNFSPQANAELALYNLKMKVSRLELLQYHIYLEMVALANGEYQLTEKFLNQEFVREINTQAGILGQVVASPKGINDTAQAIINTPFHGAKWSDAIWRRQQALRMIVAQATENTIIKGKSPLTLIPILRREFGVSVAHAKRLAVTETARVQTAVQKASYEANDIERYIFMAEPTACPICASLDEKSFLVSEMQPGKNACPMHPHCHCSTSPDTKAEREKLEKMLQEIEREREEQKQKEKEKPKEYVVVDSKMQKDMQKKSNKAFRSMTYPEKNAVVEYTGTSYRRINMVLRGMEEENSEYVQESIKIISQVLDKNEIEQDLMLYRGINGQEFGSILRGDGFKTFTSTSINQEVAEGFDDFLVVIRAPSGTKGLYIGDNSQLKGERELLLQKGQKYRIINVENTVVEVELHE